MTIAIILGTRPEIIKMAPVIRECQRRGLNFCIIHTGQHYSYQMDRIFFEQLELPQPDHNLDVGSGNHGEQTGRILAGLEAVLMAERPDVVLVQGDTNTVMAGALATRTRVDVSVLHDRAPLFVRLSDGAISNGFTYKILNMERQPKTFTLDLAGIDGARLKAVGVAAEWTDAVDLPVAPDDIGTFRVLVRVEADKLAGRSTDMVFRLKDRTTGRQYNHQIAFSGPGAARSTPAGVP